MGTKVVDDAHPVLLCDRPVIPIDQALRQLYGLFQTGKLLS
jgi:hypothetical protein